MADKKNTSKIVTNSADNLRSKTVSELEKLLHTAKDDLLVAQKSLKANELANPKVVRKMRRDIARIKTILAEVSKKQATQANEKENK
jgi:ribosomal protein L29